MIRETGADCADAVTPTPMGDLLRPSVARKPARFHPLRGVSPTLWLPEVPLEKFRTGVLDWLALKKFNSRFIANAGDQVPPDARNPASP